ncbi:MAG: NAD(P)/FAD-dependent oxidoreductase [Deltaproteobacteria bacterium]|nr:MAG: NAD(P)/FAD-dependent oxidoreductase [Deltaproteobacteria bacterium]
MGDPDIVVIGSGPNGLTAACRLARAGLRVLVCEANPRRPGGAVGTVEATLPGYLHDVGAAFFPWGRLSPAFRALALEDAGLAWHLAPIDSCHPALDGSVAILGRDVERAARHFGTPEDGAALRRLVTWYQRIEPDLLRALLEPLVPVRPALRLLPHALRLADVFGRSGAGLARRLFRSEAARRVMPGLALHVDVGPEDRFGAALGFMLGMTATTGGYAIPRGGAQSVADALVRRLEAAGGRLRLGARVRRVLDEGGRARGVVLEDGTEIPATHAVVADTDVAALLLGMVDRGAVPSYVADFLARYPRGFGTFKMDWALDAPVPWSEPLARESAVVHAGESLADLDRFTRMVRAGEIPTQPYLVIGQQSLFDPTRAPEGGHVLWAYSRVPSQVPGGWARHAEAFADAVEARIEGLAPGFRATVRARRIHTPDDLERMDANLVGGDLGGGSNAWHRQLVFRPIFPYFRYRTPVPGLYLASSYAHPGAGVHGMCGWNAAQRVLADLRWPEAEA